jgi:hypothetical protein
MSPTSSVAPSANLPSAANSGFAAISTSNKQLNLDAQQIANPDNQNVIIPLLDAGQSPLQTEAGAAVIRASNQMLGTLFDAFA